MSSVSSLGLRFHYLVPALSSCLIYGDLGAGVEMLILPNRLRATIIHLVIYSFLLFNRAVQSVLSHCILYMQSTFLVQFYGGWFLCFRRVLWLTTQFRLCLYSQCILLDEIAPSVASYNLDTESQLALVSLMASWLSIVLFTFELANS